MLPIPISVPAVSLDISWSIPYGGDSLGRLVEVLPILDFSVWCYKPRPGVPALPAALPSASD